MKLHKSFVCVKMINNYKRLLRNLKSGKIKLSFYVVAFVNDNESLEIINSYMFLQKYIRMQRYEFVCFTITKYEAFEYIRRLAEVSIRKYGEFNAKRTLAEIGREELTI